MPYKYPQGILNFVHRQLLPVQIFLFKEELSDPNTEFFLHVSLCAVVINALIFAHRERESSGE